MSACMVVVSGGMIGGGIHCGHWQFGASNLRTSTKKYVVERIGKQIEEGLRREGVGDPNTYRPGLVGACPFWAKYRCRIGAVPEEIISMGHLPMKMPYKQWHSFFTNLYRIDGVRVQFWFEGGTLSNATIRVRILRGGNDDD